VQLHYYNPSITITDLRFYYTEYIYRVFLNCLDKFQKPLSHTSTKIKIHADVCHKTTVLEIQTNNLLTQSFRILTVVILKTTSVFSLNLK